MIIDKLKEVQLVVESKALKICPSTKTFQRYDKTVYIEEPFTTQISGNREAYVEAQKFSSLFPITTRIDIEPDYVKLTLNNGAEYILPDLDTTKVKWETDDSPKLFDESKSINIKLATGRLTSTTLKNLANPMLQCIFIDSDTGVSCNSMVACIDGTTTSNEPLLIPPDVVTLMEGREAQLMKLNEKYIIKLAEAFVICPIPNYSYSETAEVLRSSLPSTIQKYPVTGLLDEIKRLAQFGEFVSFDKTKVLVGENFEPFEFPTAEPDYNYGAQYLITILPQVSHIAQSEFALLLYGDNYLFMVSPETINEGAN